ncbi:MAG: putative peptidase M28 [Streblomastix strix]|uniref:Putative peptidase M28 n=2 Tax=Streblomastix strix TaxID=222440 RepID=A0A5J4WRC8_9EUKA|nr:MAG: putative peptidase M28 [Streblomastix strix]KAA6397474.1 MAG: putative peptidase M28 [Streblomastix strix]
MQIRIQLKNTELVVLLTGSEEAGIRGTKAYVYRHQRELKETPTLCIAVDSIRDIDEMALFTRDLNGIVKLDEQSANLINQAASNSCQITLPLKPMPFGATDAVAFAQVGIKTVALCAMELTPPRWYHTRLDTPENMIPSTIEKCMEVCYHAALLFDEVGFEGSANRTE